MIFFQKRNNKKLLLAFEYGIILSNVAKAMDVELTTEIVKRAEDMIINEFKGKSPTKLATDMHPNLLSIFETDLNSDNQES